MLLAFCFFNQGTTGHLVTRLQGAKRAVIFDPGEAGTAWFLCGPNYGRHGLCAAVVFGGSNPAQHALFIDWVKK